MKLLSDNTLLINQWQAAPKFSALIQRFIATWQTLASALTAADQPDVKAVDLPAGEGTLEKMLHVDTAEGVWLDYLGKRVGIDRPNVVVDHDVTTFGYRGATNTDTFDAVPFKGELAGTSRAPLNDIEFRQMVKARGVCVTARGGLEPLKRAVSFIDPAAEVIDNRDMTITILTNKEIPVQRANQYGALPRTAGVRINVTDGRGFGLDEAGEGFDRVRFKDNK